ncbi:unnamed protein product [Orchesella dallaii]|uniref:Uncharacterized protein n=1 Tax=Orchesella dallaii TaxID=48710 RepID=A0ABP1QTQ0_9HEXA
MLYQDAPKISNSNGDSEHTLPTYVSSPELSGIPILLTNKNIEIDKPRVKRGLKSGITGLFNRGSKQPQPITQRPRSNSLPSFPAAFPSTSPIGLFNSANKQPFTSRPRSNSLPIILPTSSPVGLLNNGNQRPFSTLPRSNSLTPAVQPITTGFSSTINNQFSRKPLCKIFQV